jgi:hypothetical protein
MQLQPNQLFSHAVLIIKRPRKLRLVTQQGIAQQLHWFWRRVWQAAASFLDIWDAALAFLGIICYSGS